LQLTNEQITLDRWIHGKLKEYLQRASTLSTRTGRPIVLYRYTIEKEDQSAEEEIATVNEKHIVVQVITYGGFMPPDFQQQYTFTFEQFSHWLIKRSSDLFLLCLENLDQEIRG
jgi:hypothetical protein